MTLCAPPAQHCAFSTFLISRRSAEVEAARSPARVTFFKFRVVGAEVEAALPPARVTFFEFRVVGAEVEAALSPARVTLFNFAL